MLQRVLPALLFAGLCLVSSGATAKADQYPPPECRRILFLGDSITFAGHYVALIDARLQAARPGQAPLIVNAGLPSETCSGLSEPGHPFPRPTVHERLERALDKFKPDLVVACYGMNDGIYHPFSEERFAAYRDGIERLIKQVRAAGARLVLLTPPPFDPLPLKDKGQLKPADAGKFAWTGIYKDYDDVLARYAAWLSEKPDGVEMVIDVRSPVLQAVAERRKQEPTFTLAPDGVHLNRAGHELLAGAILKAWGYDPQQQPDAKLLELAERRATLLRDAWLSHIGHQRPGMKAGLPLEQAERQAAELAATIGELVQ